MNLLNAHQFWGSIVRSRVPVDEFCYYLAGGEKKRLGNFLVLTITRNPFWIQIYMGMDIWNISNLLFACFEFTY